MSKKDDRRELLKEYIVACVRDSALSWQDLANAAFFDKLLRVLSKDVKIVLKDLGQQSTAGLMQMGMNMLAKFAVNAAKK